MRSFPTFDEACSPQRTARLLGWLAACLLLAAPLIAGETTVWVEPGEVPPASLVPYEIQVGDVLDILFFTPAELNQSRTVGPDGEIHLLIVGRVKVAGRRVEDLTAELTERYSVELVDPELTVSVREFSGLQVYVGGEVGTPGMVGFRGGMTALQAIFDAGGFETTARRKSVVLIRKGPEDQPVGSLLNLREVLKHGDFATDIVLQASDILFVPRKNIANVNLFVEQYFKNNWPVPFSLQYQIF